MGWGVEKVDWGEGVGWGCAVGPARQGEMGLAWRGYLGIVTWKVVIFGEFHLATS